MLIDTSLSNWIYMYIQQCKEKVIPMNFLFINIIIKPPISHPIWQKWKRYSLWLLHTTWNSLGNTERNWELFPHHQLLLSLSLPPFLPLSLTLSPGREWAVGRVCIWPKIASASGRGMQHRVTAKTQGHWHEPDSEPDNPVNEKFIWWVEDSYMADLILRITGFSYMWCFNVSISF